MYKLKHNKKDYIGVVHSIIHLNEPTFNFVNKIDDDYFIDKDYQIQALFYAEVLDVWFVKDLWYITSNGSHLFKSHNKCELLKCVETEEDTKIKQLAGETYFKNVNSSGSSIERLSCSYITRSFRPATKEEILHFLVKFYIVNTNMFKYTFDSNSSPYSSTQLKDDMFFYDSVLNQLYINVDNNKTILYDKGIWNIEETDVNF